MSTETRFLGFIPGDCNGDGEVNAADFACSNMAAITADLQTELNLLPGDMDGGGVGFSDFLLLRDNFGMGQAPPAAVPEPSSVALLALGALLLGLVRRCGR